MTRSYSAENEFSVGKKYFEINCIDNAQQKNQSAV
jgi:hypothetical protein